MWRAITCFGRTRGWRVPAWVATTRFGHELLPASMRSNCITCHQRPADDLHAGFPENCGECHSSQQWLPATLDHDPWFRFDRHHPAGDCSSCHQQNNWKEYSCYGCHEHSEAGIRREHLEEGIRDFNNCVECHRSGNEHEIVGRRGERRKHDREEHDDD